MRLYNVNLSPFASRCRIQIYAKGLEVELADPPGGPSSDEYKRINPTGRVPALEVEGVVIPESDAICEYLEDRFPAVALRPADSLNRARMRVIQRLVDNYLIPPLQELFEQVDPKTRDAERVTTNLEKLQPAFDLLDGYLTPTPYAVGPDLSLADSTLMPFFFFATRILPLLGGPDPMAGRSRLAAWWKAALENEAIARVNGEMERALIDYMSNR